MPRKIVADKILISVELFLFFFSENKDLAFHIKSYLT